MASLRIVLLLVQTTGEETPGQDHVIAVHLILTSWCCRVAALDPSAFSYRLAANLPLDDEARQDLLSLPSAAER